MAEIGICLQHRLDFPVHIARTSPYRKKKYESDRPCYTTDAVEEKHTRLFRGNHSSVELRMDSLFMECSWFAAYHNHLVRDHQTLEKSPPWAAKDALDGEWFRGVDEAKRTGKSDVYVKLNTGLKPLKGRGQRFFGVINKQTAMPLENRSEWRHSSVALRSFLRQVSAPGQHKKDGKKIESTRSPCTTNHMSMQEARERILSHHGVPTYMPLLNIQRRSTAGLEPEADHVSTMLHGATRQ